MEYYIIASESLVDFMEDSLNSAKERMKYIKDVTQYRHLLKVAPAFIFDKPNDFIQAVKADIIVVLIKPNTMYKFEILGHDPHRKRIIINDLEIVEVEPSIIEEIIIDQYPLQLS